MIFHFRDTQININKPVTKIGNDIPSKTKIELAVSRNLPLCLAAKIPSPTPMINQMINEPIAKLMVIGKA